MEVFALLENTSCREDLTAEHGLSLYIQTGKHNILFDAGQSDAFAHNAKRMGIDLKQVDLAILSHGHYDHGGGLGCFLEENQTAPVYLSRRAFQPHYNGAEKYIGLDPTLQASDRIRYVDGDLDLGDGLKLIAGANLPQPFPADSYGLNVAENGVLHPDSFLHEQYLMVEEAGKRILFSGCSHRGILNIADHFRPDVLIGGFHFKKLDPEGSGAPVLEEAARILAGYPTRYFTCHCTGQSQYEFLRERMGDQLSYLQTGSHLTL